MADPSPQGPAKTYTAVSVIAVFFFMPTALAAVFQSGKAYAANEAQQWELAHAASAKARLWQNITGLVFIVVLLLSLFSQCTYNP